MENKNMLSDEELEKVAGGSTIEFDGRTFDSLEVLDKIIDYQNDGDMGKVMYYLAVIAQNMETFFADIEKAGRELPRELAEIYGF